MKESDKAKRPRRQRKRWVRMALVNVRAQPHRAGADTYAQLWNAAVQDGYNVAFHRDKRAVIATSQRLSDNVFAGEIWIYTLIGAKSGVLDLSTGRLLAPDEFSEQAFGFDVKRHGFNAKKIPYVFLADAHRVGIELNRGLSPRFLSYILEKALNQLAPLAAAAASLVQVDVEQKPQALQDIFALRLDTLTVVVRQPNSEDLEDLDDVVMKALQRQNAAEQKTELRAEPEKKLNPDSATRGLAQVALSNGFVSGHGRDPQTDKATSLTTLDAPLVDAAEYDPNTEIYSDMLFRLARRMAAKIRGRNLS